MWLGKTQTFKNMSTNFKFINKTTNPKYLTTGVLQ